MNKKLLAGLTILLLLAWMSPVVADVFNNYSSGAPLLGTDIFIISKNGAGTRKVGPGDIATYVQSNTTTDNIAEGSTNKYYTDERVDDRTAALMQAGPGLGWTYNDGANTLTINNTSDVYLTTSAVESDIQTAMNTIAAANGGTRKHTMLHLGPATSYTITSGLKLETEYVNLDCHGSILAAAGINTTTGIALNVQNTLGIPTNGSQIDEASTVQNCRVEGDSTQSGSGYNSTVGVIMQGTPDLNSYTLSSGINSSQTTFVFSSSTNLPAAPFTVTVDSETMLVGTLSGANASNVTRGIYGTTAASHSSGHTINTWHIVSPVIRNLSVHYFHENAAIGDSAFAGIFENLYSANAYYAFYAANATNTAQAENNRVYNADIYNSTVGFRGEHMIVRFYGTSFDYNQQAVQSALGTQFECYGCHIESNYGQNGGETTQPIYVSDADSAFIYIGGMITYTGTYPRNWSNGGCYALSSNNTQNILFIGTRFVNIGVPDTDTTSDDAFTCGTNANHNTQNIAKTTLKDIYTSVYGTNHRDFPSTVAYEAGPNKWLNGCGWTWGEWGSRVSLTGTATATSASGDDGSVVRKCADSLLKLSGTGHMYVTIPASAGSKMLWSLMANGGNATGTMTVNEIWSTVNPVWNGTNSLTWSQDTRGQAASTYSFPTIGTNTWTRVSWKNVRASQTYNNPVTNDAFVVLDFNLAISAGTVDLDMASLTGM